MKVKFCKHNQWNDAVIARITETDPTIKISTKKCFGKCHRCKSNPIAMVGKELLVGTDEENLYNMIITKLLIP